MGIKGTSFIFFLLAWPSLISAVNPETHANTSLQEPPPKPTSDVADVKLGDSAELVSQDNLREFDPLTASVDDHSEAKQLQNHAYAYTNTSAPSTTTTPASSTTTTLAPSTTTPCPPPSHEPTMMQALTTPSILIFLYSRLTQAITLGFLLISIVLDLNKVLTLIPNGMETIAALVIGLFVQSAGEIGSQTGGLSRLELSYVLESAIASGFPDTSEFRGLMTFLSTAAYYFGWYLGCGVAPSLVGDYEGRVFIIMVFNGLIIYCYYIVNNLMY